MANRKYLDRTKDRAVSRSPACVLGSEGLKRPRNASKMPVFFDGFPMPFGGRPKDSRSWAIIVDGLGAAQGTYGRTGAEKGASIFSQRGGEHLLLLEKAKSIWKVVHKERQQEILASAPMQEST